jgi:hypothetical protein
MPDVLQRQIGAFTAQYERQYKRRKLTWHLNLSRAEVRATFLERKYDITMSIKHLSVLLVFEDQGGQSNRGAEQEALESRAVSLGYICDVTGLSSAQVRWGKGYAGTWAFVC